MQSWQGGTFSWQEVLLVATAKGCELVGLQTHSPAQYPKEERCPVSANGIWGSGRRKFELVVLSPRAGFGPCPTEHISPTEILLVLVLLLPTGVWAVKWMVFPRDGGRYPGQAPGRDTASTPMAEHELGELMGLPLSLWELSGSLSHQVLNAPHNRSFLLACYCWLPGRAEIALGQVGNRSYPESH